MGGVHGAENSSGHVPRPRPPRALSVVRVVAFWRSRHGVSPEVVTPGERFLGVSRGARKQRKKAQRTDAIARVLGYAVLPVVLQPGFGSGTALALELSGSRALGARRVAFLPVAPPVGVSIHHHQETNRWPGTRLDARSPPPSGRTGRSPPLPEDRPRRRSTLRREKLLGATAAPGSAGEMGKAVSARRHEGGAPDPEGILAPCHRVPGDGYVAEPQRAPTARLGGAPAASAGTRRRRHIAAARDRAEEVPVSRRAGRLASVGISRRCSHDL